MRCGQRITPRLRDELAQRLKVLKATVVQQPRSEPVVSHGAVIRPLKSDEQPEEGRADLPVSVQMQGGNKNNAPR